MRELRSFQQGDEELRGSMVIEFLSVDQGIVGSCESTTATAATERLSEALRVNNVELFLLWIKALWNQGLRIFRYKGAT